MEKQKQYNRCPVCGRFIAKGDGCCIAKLKEQVSYYQGMADDFLSDYTKLQKQYEELKKEMLNRPQELEANKKIIEQLMKEKREQQELKEVYRKNNKDLLLEVSDLRADINRLKSRGLIARIINK